MSYKIERAPAQKIFYVHTANSDVLDRMQLAVRNKTLSPTEYANAVQSPSEIAKCCDDQWGLPYFAGFCPFGPYKTVGADSPRGPLAAACAAALAAPGRWVVDQSKNTGDESRAVFDALHALAAYAMFRPDYKVRLVLEPFDMTAKKTGMALRKYFNALPAGFPRLTTDTVDYIGWPSSNLTVIDCADKKFYATEELDLLVWLGLNTWSALGYEAVMDLANEQALLAKTMVVFGWSEDNHPGDNAGYLVTGIADQPGFEQFIAPPAIDMEAMNQHLKQYETTDPRVFDILGGEANKKNEPAEEAPDVEPGDVSPLTPNEFGIYKISRMQAEWAERVQTGAGIVNANRFMDLEKIRAFAYRDTCSEILRDYETGGITGAINACRKFIAVETQQLNEMDWRSATERYCIAVCNKQTAETALALLWTPAGRIDWSTETAYQDHLREFKTWDATRQTEFLQQWAQPILNRRATESAAGLADITEAEAKDLLTKVKQHPNRVPGMPPAKSRKSDNPNVQLLHDKKGN